MILKISELPSFLCLLVWLMMALICREMVRFDKLLRLHTTINVVLKPSASRELPVENPQYYWFS